MKGFRTTLLIGCALLLAFAVVGKSLSVFLSERSLHRFRVLQAGARDRGESLGDLKRATQWRLLQRAQRWSPENGLVHFELGKMLHRLGADSRTETLGVRCESMAIESQLCEPKKLFSEAIRHYDLAIRFNRKISQARYWRLAAQVAIHDRSTSAQASSNRSALPPQWLDRLRDVMRYEGGDPGLYLHAGDLASRAGDEQQAATYYRRSLALSLEGLESIVSKVILWTEGTDALERIVPDTAQAQDRLSDALVDSWRIDQARRAWRRARNLMDEPVYPDDPTNLVANGSFADPLSSHFLGWEWLNREGVVFEKLPDSAGLLIRMNNAPATYFHLVQQVAVEPEVTYRFAAKVKFRGRDFRSNSSFGFEVIHPYDFSIWSAGKRCEVQSAETKTVCRDLETDEAGFSTLQFTFSPPSPLRMVLLRLVWTADGKQGRLWIDDIWIEKIVQDEEAADVPTT